jgi:serine/threonine-protein kinase
VLDHSFHRFGPFVIIRTLGRGGMGEVFVARTPWKENPLAAVKRLRPDVARVPTFAERFAHEAELAVRLQHGNVVGTLDVGSVEGQLYVASELVLGKDTGLVADRLRERGQGGPAAVAIRLLLDTLGGLAYVHGVREPSGQPLELVHRDVTPGNVLVGYDGVARLADFGLAKSHLTERSNLTNHGEILGTPHYLAPEVIRGGKATPASDLYGMGAVMYRFLTGVAPHQGTTAEVLLKVLSEEPRPLSDLRPDLPPWLVVFVHRLLEKDPAHRPFDAAILHKQLLNDAKASGLLVPKAAVGRWLGTLFETEKAEELEEYERVASIEPDAIPDEPEGTVVLARPRTGSKLEAPSPVDQDYVDSLGTELDLSEEEVRAAIPLRPLRSVAEDSGANVTEAARAAHFPSHELSDPDLLDARRDGMATQAVTVLGRSFEAGGAGDVLDPDTHDGVEEEATKFGSFLEGKGKEPLPGFVDEAKNARIPVPAVRRDLDVGATAPEPESPPVAPPAPQRRRPNPESVIVSPVPVPPRARPTPAPIVAPVARPPDPQSVPPIGEKKRPEPPRKPSPQRAPARPPRRATGSSMGRNLLLLTGLLCIAVALGIGIGVLVASLKPLSPRSAPAAQTALKQRFLALERQMNERSQKGERVPAGAWELKSSASAALIEGREDVALAKIAEAERLLRDDTAQR